MYTFIKNAWRCRMICIAFILVQKMPAQLTFTINSVTGNFSITCTDTTLRLFATTAYTGATTTYSWGVPPTGFYSNFATFTTTGIYQVTAMAGSLTAVQTFTVWDNRQQPTILYAQPAILDCFTPTIFTPIVSVPSATFSWAYQSDVPTTVTSSGFSVSANYTLAPTHTLVSSFTLTATDTLNGCSNVAVIPMYQDIYAPHIAVSGPERSITCKTPGVLLVNASTTRIPPGSGFANTAAVIATWYQVASPTIALTASYIAHTPGTYTMVAQDINNGCTASTLITIGDARIYPVISTQDHSVLDCPNGIVSLSVQTDGDPGFVSYQWTGPAGASVSGDTTSQITTNTEGNYTVTVTSDSTGCSSSTSISVWACVGLENESTPASRLKLSPNPASDHLSLEWTGVSHMELDIRNAYGQLIYSKTGTGLKENIDTRQWAAGVYYANVKNAQGQQVFKIIKE